MLQKGIEDRVVSERLIAQIDFFSWIGDSFTVSPDNKRVACGARMGKLGDFLTDKWFSNKCSVVVDGKEEGPYDDLLTWAGGRIVFDSPDGLHYLAKEGSKLYLVEEKIK